MTKPASEPADLLRALFDALDVGVLVANDSAVYVEANLAASRLLGRRRDELVGAHLSEVVEEARRPEAEAQWRAFLRDGSQSGVFSVLLPDGTLRPLRFHAQAHLLPGRHVSFLTPAEPLASPESGAGPFLTLCAWTKRVRMGDRWVSIERYLREVHGVTVTHGMSPQARTVFVSGAPDPPGAPL
jgi:PAS domain S-box-containing protein